MATALVSGRGDAKGRGGGVRRMLTAGDRWEISAGLKAGWSIRAIATDLGRAPSAVCLGHNRRPADQKQRREQRRPTFPGGAKPVLRATF